jgi:hypothetical protein
VIVHVALALEEAQTSVLLAQMKYIFFKQIIPVWNIVTEINSQRQKIILKFVQTVLTIALLVVLMNQHVTAAQEPFI